jgi:hypothetical protein
MSEAKEKPIRKFRAGTIQASIWARQTDKGQSLSVSIVKSYKDEKTGNWKETTTFFPDDLPKLAMLARNCFEYITLQTEGS